MTRNSDRNPLLGPIKATFLQKRKHGLIPANWLLALLRIIDAMRGKTTPTQEDEIYSYDYTLSQSRQMAITRLLDKYKFPKSPIGPEGVTVRGAPCLRFFREVGGGSVVCELEPAQREAFFDEAVELIREEFLKVVNKDPVSLPRSVFERSGAFVEALLETASNRSHGRVEQALVGAKLQLRHPTHDIPINPGFAADRQTGREADFEVDALRVMVTVAPKPQHYETAKKLSDEGRQVILVVSKDKVANAQKHISEIGCRPQLVRVKSVEDYVTDNMLEIASDLRISAHEMCIKLLAEYNRRIVADNDVSLQVVSPNTDEENQTRSSAPIQQDSPAQARSRRKGSRSRRKQ